MTATKCLIWGTPAQAMPKIGHYEHIVSRRAGGEYKVTDSAIHELGNLTASEKTRLTTWIVSQRKAGIAVPEINNYMLVDVRRNRDMPFTERLNQALLFIGTRTKVGTNVALDRATFQSREALDDFLALTASTTDQEAWSLL